MNNDLLNMEHLYDRLEQMKKAYNPFFYMSIIRYNLKQQSLSSELDAFLKTFEEEVLKIKSKFS